MKNLANIIIKSEFNQNRVRIQSELSCFFTWIFYLIAFNLQFVNLILNYMKKILCSLSVLVILVTTFNFTIINKRINNVSCIVLKNIEALSYAETTNENCYGVGSVDCPNSKEKVKFVL